MHCPSQKCALTWLYSIRDHDVRKKQRCTDTVYGGEPSELGSGPAQLFGLRLVRRIQFGLLFEFKTTSPIFRFWIYTVNLLDNLI